MDQSDASRVTEPAPLDPIPTVSEPAPIDGLPTAPAPRAPRSKRRALAREIVVMALLALFIFVGVRAVVQNFKVEGASMEPSLHTGQYLFINKAEYFFHSPERGDVVVFRYPQDPSRDFIKRVVGLPGEAVSIRSGKVFINDLLLDDPFSQGTGSRDGEWKLGPDQYFVMGDNRAQSSDSRFWGPVPRDNVIGKAMLIYWPLSSWGWAPNYTLAVGNNNAR